MIKVVDFSEHYDINKLNTEINDIITRGWQIKDILNGCGKKINSDFRFCIMFSRETKEK